MKLEDALKAVYQGHNVLLTGQCGTGKTHTIRKCIQQLRCSGKDVAGTAITGLSSIHYLDLQGSTLHHWAGLSDGRFSQLFENILHNDAYRDCLKHILSDVLIIDEIGMLSAKAFDSVEYLCRHVRQSQILFGQLQVIASGDFKQLPPVPNSFHEDPGQFCFESPIFNEVFPHHINVDEVVRQSEPDLINAINELCNGNPSEETHELLESLQRPLSQKDEAVQIFGTNFDVEYENCMKLEELPGEIRVYRSVDTGELQLLRTCQARRLLQLKAGPPVVSVRNIDRTLVNGLRGTVDSFTDEGPYLNFGEKIALVKNISFETYDTRAQKIRANKRQSLLRLA